VQEHTQRTPKKSASHFIAPMQTKALFAVNADENAEARVTNDEN